MESGVILRPWKIEDASDLAVAINNKKILVNLRDGIPYPYAEKDAVEFITATLDAGKDTQYAFAVTVNEKVIGSIGVFRKENVHRLTAELGYYIAEPYWGKGFMTEAVRQMCAYVFDNTDIIRIFAEPYAFNQASCRVLEKAGFQFEGILRQNAVKSGQSVDMKMYALLKTDEEAGGLSDMKDIIISLIAENKKDFLPLLLLGDEQESQIDKYLERGELFALYDGDVKSVCVVTDEGRGTLEIQNLATDQRHQRKGYASRLIEYITNHYAERYDKIILGTGDVPGILGFYERHGFAVTHRIPDYFTTHYDHPMIEDDVLLKDKVYLERKLIFDIINLTLRLEQPDETRENENVTREAFWNIHVPGCDEHYLLHIMRDSPAFVPGLNLVAVYEGRIIGNAVCAKSVIRSDDGNDYEMLGLGPISVLPEYQSKGVGGRLIEHTKQIARDMGYQAILLYGDPAYYSRHRFVAAESFDIRTSDNMYAEALQVCELYENALSDITGCYFENEVYEIDGAAAAEFDKTFPLKEKVKGTASQKRFSELVDRRKERS